MKTCNVTPERNQRAFEDYFGGYYFAFSETRVQTWPRRPRHLTTGRHRDLVGSDLRELTGLFVEAVLHYVASFVYIEQFSFLQWKNPIRIESQLALKRTK